MCYKSYPKTENIGYISFLITSNIHISVRGSRGRDRMVVRFTATCAISAYHH